MGEVEDIPPLTGDSDALWKKAMRSLSNQSTGVMTNKETEHGVKSRAADSVDFRAEFESGSKCKFGS